MSTKIIKSDVKGLVAKELALSYEQFPAFCSPHEGHGVIREEFEELQEDVDCLSDCMRYIWQGIKDNDAILVKPHLNAMEANAINAACEAIQVAAMCQKYRESLIGDQPGADREKG